MLSLHCKASVFVPKINVSGKMFFLLHYAHRRKRIFLPAWLPSQNLAACNVTGNPCRPPFLRLVNSLFLEIAKSHPSYPEKLQVKPAIYLWVFSLVSRLFLTTFLYPSELGGLLLLLLVLLRRDFSSAISDSR